MYRYSSWNSHNSADFSFTTTLNNECASKVAECVVTWDKIHVITCPRRQRWHTGNFNLNHFPSTSHSTFPVPASDCGKQHESVCDHAVSPLVCRVLADQNEPLLDRLWFLSASGFPLLPGPSHSQPTHDAAPSNHQRVITTRWWLPSLFHPRRRPQQPPTSRNDSLGAFLPSTRFSGPLQPPTTRWWLPTLFHSRRRPQRVITTRWGLSCPFHSLSLASPATNESWWLVGGFHPSSTLDAGPNNPQQLVGGSLLPPTREPGPSSHQRVGRTRWWLLSPFHPQRRPQRVTTTRWRRPSLPPHHPTMTDASPPRVFATTCFYTTNNPFHHHHNGDGDDDGRWKYGMPF